MAPSRPRSLKTLAFGSGRRNTSPGPPSPTFSDATHASAINFGANGPEKIITRTHLKASLQAYEDLVNSSAAYRAALLTLSKATAGFADAIERCSGLKGPTYEAGTRLQAASGVHHLMGNLWHVLSESLDKNFEAPLRQHLEGYRATVNERSQTYERALREKSRLIRETETRSMNRKERNLQNFREALAVLQRQVDDLDELKASHYHEIVDHEEEVWDSVQSKICVVVRSEMDVFDRITSKASDPIVEPMLQSVPDPFDSYGPPQAEDQIFSILAPLSIMTGATSSTASPLTSSTPERDPMDSLPSSAMNKITSWLPGTNGTHSPESADWAKVPLPPATPPRSTSPPVSTSPPSSGPNRRHSVPVVQRKSESKLRSVLSAIQEVKPPLETDDTTPSGPSPLPSVLTNIVAPHPDRIPDTGWNFTYGQSTYDTIEGGQLTPRHSTLFSSESPPPHSETPSNRDLHRLEPDEHDQVHVKPIAI
ncbi:hypothetical protein GALMADRAFT_55517 [Galerina marginata CBS 339.88]|uniref:IMD domain-containing protein n=1 Tax=Galerina marginata (strain CBS 339.88) TaxID=685588 RepID=A0A067TLY7_GALM3|nr:hypothetical protein GALMADRAFT_55517 [Galerina marginata CBS 339.88]